MQATKDVVRCPLLSQPTPSGTGCSGMHPGEFVTHCAPLRYRKLYA
jgi:hypothetical protein